MKKVEHVGALVQKRSLVALERAQSLSVPHSHLWGLAKAGKIERVARGLYRAKDAPIFINQTLLEVAKGGPSHYWSEIGMAFRPAALISLVTSRASGSSVRSN